MGIIFGIINAISKILEYDIHYKYIFLLSNYLKGRLALYDRKIQ